MDELERRLCVIAAEVGKVKFSPTGCNYDDFNFIVSCKNHALLFTHDDIRVEVSEFKLIDREKWDSDERHRYFRVVHRSGIGLLWYACNVKWQVGKQNGKGDNVALGYGSDRDRALSGLMPNSSTRTAIEDLLVAIERVTGSIFGDELLDKQTAGKERKFPEDGIRVREREF